MIAHKSDCSVHNEPAFPKGECDCGAVEDETKIPSCHCSSCRPNKEVKHGIN